MVSNNDSEKAEIMAFREYMTKEELHNPIAIDNANFFKLLDNIRSVDSKVIFLTARDNSLYKQTLNHLEKIGLFINPLNLYFNQNKGDELFNIVNNKYYNIKNIVFIDDLFFNIKNVQSKFCFSKYNLILYHIQHPIL